MDPPQCEWTYDEDAQAIVVTTTTVVCSYFYPGSIYEEVELNILLAHAVIPEAPLRQPLGPWDFLPKPLSDIKMEPMSPELLAIPITELMQSPLHHT